MSDRLQENFDVDRSTSSSSDSGDEEGRLSEPAVDGDMLAVLRSLRGADDASALLRLLSGEHGSGANLSASDLLRRIWIELARMTPPPRQRLCQHSTLDDVVSLIQSKHRIMIITGAGISVSCGIPDFRSKSGIYSILHRRYPNLDDPKRIFEIDFFVHNPKPFFSFAKEMYPGSFEPSLTHRFIRSIEKMGKLLRNYTQNIDSLEKIAGIERVIYCHGSLATASCMLCARKVDVDEIKQDVMRGEVPMCTECGRDDRRAIMKPDIVFFNEGLPSSYGDSIAEDTGACDLLLVIGSSLKVCPVNKIPYNIPRNVPQILINREPLSQYQFEVELLGDCDVIFNELALRLGEPYDEICTNKERLIEMDENGLNEDQPTGSVSVVNGFQEKQRTSARNGRITVPNGRFVCKPPNRYLFAGAEVVRES